MHFKISSKMIGVPLVSLLWLLLSSCGGDSKSFIEAIEANNLAISAITIATDKPVINADGTAQYTATGTPLEVGQPNVDLTNTVTWSVSDTSLASIDSSGLFTAKADGMVTVTAAFANLAGTGEQLINTAALTSLQITGAAPVDECQNLQLDASGQFDDGTSRAITDEVIWSVLFPSGTTAQATIGSSSGLLQTSNAGTITARASTASVSGEASIEISDTLDSIVVTPANSSLVVASSQVYSATGSYAGQSVDISANSAFNSSSTTVASFNAGNPTRLTAVVAGSSVITVSCGGLEVNTPVTVTQAATLDSVRINGGNATLTVKESDLTEQLELTAVFSDGSTTTVTEDAVWSVESKGTTEVTMSNSGSNSGLITINTGKGEASIKAVYLGQQTTLKLIVE